MTRQTVLLGMSGGVDSSVAASLLVRQGYDVHGVTLQVWEHEDDQVAVSKRWEERGCCKIGIAKYVAQRLRIPYEVVDRREVFQQGVIDDFVAGYASGTTPNPCVRCNERVKLRSLYALAHERGLDYVATGHYARVQQIDGQWSLHRALDARKDQSYFLYRINPAWLPHLLFPVGHMQKCDVWQEAESLGLPVEELKESQEICFVSHGDYRTFIEQEMPEAKKPGPFVARSSGSMRASRSIRRGNAAAWVLPWGSGCTCRKWCLNPVRWCYVRKISLCSQSVRSPISVCLITPSVGSRLRRT